MPQDTAERIDELLRARFSPQHLELRDEGAAHAGHAHAGQGHFRLRIVSSRFCGLKPLERHRLVNETLGPLFENGVHALTLEALTPQEYGLTNLPN
jgi:BolA protein